MYLPLELSPRDQRRFAVIVPSRATGVQEITYITTDEGCANDVARAAGGYVVLLEMSADFR